MKNLIIATLAVATAFNTATSVRSKNIFLGEQHGETWLEVQNIRVTSGKDKDILIGNGAIATVDKNGKPTEGVALVAGGVYAEFLCLGDLEDNIAIMPGKKNRSIVVQEHKRSEPVKNSERYLLEPR